MSSQLNSEQATGQLAQRVERFGQTVLELSWTPEDTLGSLEELFRVADELGESTAAYYLRKGSEKRFPSMALRAAAILFGGAGALVPLISNAGGWDFAEWGYVGFAAAAACMGADRAFGTSTGWMRFMTSHLKLTQALMQYRFEWALQMADLASRSEPLAAEDISAAIGRSMHFTELVNQEVLRETDVWAKEFMSALSELERSLRTKREAEQSGSLRVEVEQAEGLEQLRILVDGAPAPLPAGNRCSVPGVPPGQHSVEAHGLLGDKRVGDSTIVEVTPGARVNVKLSLLS